MEQAQGRRSAGRRLSLRKVLGAVVVGFLMAVIATAMMGGSASSKFQSVGTAINSASRSDTDDASSAAAGDYPGDEASGGVGAGGAVPEVDATASTDATMPGEGGTAADVDLAGAQLATSGRDIISTAEMHVQVDDVAAASSAAVAAATPLGAVLYGQNSDMDETPEATLTFKVPPEAFPDLQTRLADLGKVLTHTVYSDDVTEQVVDLEARIISAQASVDRIRALMAETSNVMELSTLEAELLRRETDLESLQGQLRAMQERVDLATVVVTYTKDPVVPEAEPATVLVLGWEEQRPGFLTGVATGWKAFLDVGSVVLAGMGLIAPFLPLVLIGWLGWRIVHRRRPAPTPTPTV